jgi:uncharacterized FAD-dependent dehydrogenase
MIVEVEISVNPTEVNDEALILRKAVQKARWKAESVLDWRIKRKSIDARKRMPVYRLRIELSKKEMLTEEGNSFVPMGTMSSRSKKVIIVGAGPAGYFAGLKCLELGLKPVIIDRGKDVRARRRDLKAIQQDGVVNPNSNYCFGEGGAGTYSDGKLYTRSHKRGNIRDILRILVDHGAKADILIDAHPHIGSNKLPQIIANIRESIETNGGEILFEHKVIDFKFDKDHCFGVFAMNGDKQIELTGDAVIVATGHSARDVFNLCAKHEVQMEAKPFALGVRLEHPQQLIDQIQYNQVKREDNLPASSYRVACQVDDVGVFSFCMCPGGLIVPASTSPEELVVNGMSLSRRDSAFANSGVVVEVSLNYLKSQGFEGIFAGVEFQQKYEQAFYNFGNGTQQAPAQKLTDFVNQTISSGEMNSSYIPGLVTAPVHELLPSFISSKIRKAISSFDQKLKGYYTDEAHVIGLESRTSSPIRIVRDKITYMSPSKTGFFPCGEGAGFAGGILSAALDGRNVTTAVKAYLG